MTRKTLNIREVLPKDNLAIGKIIRQVLLEMGAPKKGTAYEDSATDTIFETYKEQVGHYYVIEEDEKIIGSGGFGALPGFEKTICELQKMYFLPEARGRGFGNELITKSLMKAKKLGFEKCYIETMPSMKSAQNLYKKKGFKVLDKPIGNTGHYACTVWMIKDL